MSGIVKRFTSILSLLFFFGDRRIATRLASGIAVIVIIFAVSMLFLWYSLHGIRQATMEVENHSTVVAAVEELSRLAVSKYADIQELMITKETSRVEQFKADSQAFADRLSFLRSQLTGQKETDILNVVEQVDQTLNESVERDIIPALGSGWEITADFTYQYVTAGAAERITEKNNELRQILLQRQNEGMQRVRVLEGAAVTNMLIALVLAIVATILLTIFLTRSITRPLAEVIDYSQSVANGDLAARPLQQTYGGEIGLLVGAFNRMVDNLRSLITRVTDTAQKVTEATQELAASTAQIGESARQVAVTVQEMARGSQEQTGHVADTVATIDRIVDDIRKVSQRVTEVAGRSEAALQAADEGEKAVTAAITQMAAIKARVDESAEAVNQLGERSREIVRIVEVITGIADQTNLLALNAAIEAARAGEQGRGFAVVAEEVRKLAEQSAQAAQQISSLIREIQNQTGHVVETMQEGTRQVESGSAVIGETGTTFRRIGEVISFLVNSVNEIATVAHGVARDAGRAGEAMQNIASITEEAASGTEEVSAAVEEQAASVNEIAAAAERLGELGAQLAQAVSQFKL